MRSRKRRQAKEACKTGGLVPRMRRLRGVAGSLTYYLVCDLFSSHCFALLPTHPRRSSCRIDRRRFRQSRGVLRWLCSSPCCSRYRPNACLYIFIIASTSSSRSVYTLPRSRQNVHAIPGRKNESFWKIRKQALDSVSLCTTYIPPVCAPS